VSLDEILQLTWYQYLPVSIEMPVSYAAVWPQVEGHKDRSRCVCNRGFCAADILLCNSRARKLNTDILQMAWTSVLGVQHSGQKIASRFSGWLRIRN
jgi:hypothetical protein